MVKFKSQDLSETPTIQSCSKDDKVRSQKQLLEWKKEEEKKSCLSAPDNKTNRDTISCRRQTTIKPEDNWSDIQWLLNLEPMECHCFGIILQINWKNYAIFGYIGQI